MMAYVRVRSPFYLLLIFVLSTAVACMPKVEEDEIVPVVTISSAAVSGPSIDRKITLIGACPLGTYMMRVLGEGAEQSIGDATSSTWVVSSGTFVGWCRNGAFQLEYPVPNPASPRQITFRIKARLSDGRSSLDWAVRTVSYDAPVIGLPGYAIASVGATTNSGILQAAGLMLHSIGGETAGNNILSSAQAQVRSGLHGIITE